VFEGLDRAGKSTQIDALREINWGAPAPTFAHMPSGSSSLTQAIYRLTERETIDSSLCRQLLHLACHAENQPFLRAARAAGGLILDRWWWSPVAYGWATGALADDGLSEDAFFGLVHAAWRDFEADVVFLFLEPYESDRFNSDAVRIGYRQLAAENPDRAVLVPTGDVDTLSTLILAALKERGLLVTSPEA
jgi:thymidylate kinase